MGECDTMGALIGERMYRFFVIALCTVLTLCGCVEPTRPTYDVKVSELKSGRVVPQLRVGVKVRVSLVALGEPIFTEEIKEVSATGDIVLPLINTVHCEGLRIEELQAILTKRFAEFFREPVVSAYYVPMSEGGSSPYGSVLVTGMVGSPGVVNIPQTCDLTVMQALQLAGGMGLWADKSGVIVTRNLADGTRQRLTVDTERIGTDGEVEQNIILMPGDVINVPESNW